jgi:hypothetical protein
MITYKRGGGRGVMPKEMYREKERKFQVKAFGLRKSFAK